MEVLETKKVFISYSWSNEEHKEKVLDLAKSLMAYGVEVILDVWDLKVGQDKYDFMEKMIKDDTLDRVLIVSDKEYSEKADMRQGGVGTETQIISPSLYSDLGKNKFIPIVFERNLSTGEEFLPLYAKGRMYIDLSNETVYQEEFEKLLREIFEKPVLKKPTLGKIPLFLTQESIDTFEVERKAELVNKALGKDRFRLTFSIKEYFDFFISDLDKLIVKQKEGEEPDEAAVRVIYDLLPYRQSCITVMKAFIQDREINNELLIDFFTDFNNKIYDVKTNTGVNGNLGAEAIRFLLTELFVVTNALFLKYKRWDLLEVVIDNFYYDYQRNKDVGFVAFRHPTRFIFNGKIEKEKKRVSLTADLMKERALEKEFKEIVEMDLVLHFISRINPTPKHNLYSNWFPITHIYLEIIDGRLNFFNLLKSQRTLNNLLPLFGVPEEELKEKVRNVKSETGYSNSWTSIPSFESFIKADEIGSTK